MLDNLIAGNLWVTALFPIAAIGSLFVLAWRTNTPRYDLRGISFYTLMFVVLSLLTVALRSAGLSFRAVGFTSVFFLLAAAARIVVAASLVATEALMGRRPQKIFGDGVMALVYGLIIAVLMGHTGISVRDLLAGSAFVTFGLSYIFKDTLGNLLAGVAIQLQRPFTIGDWIAYDDKREHFGKIKEINWRATTIETLDRAEIVIPNSKLSENPIVNFTKPTAHSRRSIYFTCACQVPPAQVHQIVLQAIAGAEGVCDEPRFSIVTNAMTPAGIEYWLRFFTTDMDRRDMVDGRVRDRIWYALARHGIELYGTAGQMQIFRDWQSPLPPDRLAIRKALADTVLFGTLPDDVIDRLADGADFRAYITGEPIVKEGEHSTEMYVILKGETIVECDVPASASSVEVARLQRGDFFGERSLLLGEARSATVSAAGICELAVLRKDEIQKILTDHLQLAGQLSRILAEREAESRRRRRDVAAVAPAEIERGIIKRLREFLEIN